MKNGRRQPFKKVVISEEELDNNDIADIDNLEDLPRLVFIDGKCGNFKTVN